MHVVLLGLNHKSAPIEVRERFNFSKLEKFEALVRLRNYDSIASGMILSTCNRVEVYARGENPEKLLQDLNQFLLDREVVDEELLEKHAYRKQDDEVVQHLFRVASSLDSMVLGEPQILGQVKDAYLAACEEGFVDPFMDHLLQKTFFVAKRIRNETRIGEQAVSTSFAAVELASEIFDDLKSTRALIIGAGEMAELAARHLKKRGVQRLVFCNRTYDHSVDLAKELEGIPIQLEKLESFLDVSDIMIVSTGADHYLIRPEQIEKALERRKRQPIYIVDISVPRNVDPAIDKLEDVYLYNIDDLQSIVNENTTNRRKEADKGQEIISSEMKRFFETVVQRQMSPLIQELQSKFRDVEAKEMIRLRTRLSHLSDEDLFAIEKAMNSLMRKALDSPIRFIRKTGSERDHEEVLRELFALAREKEKKA